MAELERIREIAERVAASESIELVDVEVHGRGPGAVVRIYLDKPGGISLEDCQTVSRQVGTILDVEDVMPGRYTLEVSSPGLDRRLIKAADFQRFAGQQVRLLLKPSGEGRCRYQGRLLGCDDDKVRVEADAVGPLSIPLQDIERANLIPETGKIGKLEHRRNRSK